jgi:DNA-binding CsgD family transcriptional regulator
VPIVIESVEGFPARVCWVSDEAGMILVRINDREMTPERLENAGLVYGLSRAQLAIASAITAGLSLGEAADKAGISINTARTHLQRIYDKTGVRNQAALVRVLLASSIMD